MTSDAVGRIDLRAANLIDFVPDSIADDPEIVALSLALDPELRDVGAAIIEAVILPNIANVSEPVLDELGWAFRLTDLQLWDTATADRKRSLLANVFAVRKKSGTRFAVRRIFDLIALEGSLTEWWEGGFSAYLYRIRITLTDAGITLEQLLQIPELTRRFAPTRSKLDQVAVDADETGDAVMYTATTSGLHTTISFGGP